MKTLRKIFVVAMSLMMLLTMIPMATGVAFADDIALATSINAQVAELGDIPKVEVKTSNSQLVLDGYEVFRSTKRYSGYGTTCFFDTKNLTYNNTKVDIGKRYFYKVRGYVLVDGERYYTPFSTKAYRKVLSTAKNKLSAVRKNKVSDATMQVTGEDLAKALDKVKFKANSKLVKRTNGMPAVSLNWTADTSGHTLIDINATAVVNKTPAWHYYGGGGGSTHNHWYSINSDGSWDCTKNGHSGATLLADTNNAYITVLNENGQPGEIIKLTDENIAETQVGEGTITKVGNNITYENTSGSGQKVVIRTNSDATTLTIKAYENGLTGDAYKCDTITHYDKCGIVNIINGGKASYHENGTVAFTEITKGKIVLESTANVEVINIAKKDETSYDEITIEDKGVEELPQIISRDQVEVTEAEGIRVCEVISAAGTEIVKAYPATGVCNSTEKVTEGESKQNETVATTLGMLVIDSGSNAGEKAFDQAKKESRKDEVAATAVNSSLETPIEGEARILKVGYPTLKEAIEAAQPGQVVVLLKDITLTSALTPATYTTSYLINKNLTIDGANYKIDAKYSGGGTNVFCINGEDLKITFKNLTIDGSAERAIQSWSPSTDNLDLTVDNCSLYATAYTLRINEAINANVKIINNTKIYGWGCIYAKASTNSTYLIQDSYIGGINDKTEASSNGFGTIVLEGANPYSSPLDPEKGKNNTVNILRSRIVAERRNGNTQEWLNLNYGIRDSVINVDDSTIIENENGKDVSREVGRSMAYDYWSKSYQANCTINFNETSWEFDSYVTLEKGETEICCGTLNEAMSKASNGDTIRVESNTFEKINNVNVNVCFAVFTYDAADTTYNDNMEVNGYTVLNQVIDTINIDGDDYEMTGYYLVKDSNILDEKIIGGTYYFDLTDLVHEGYHINDNGNGTWTVVAD